MSVITQLILQPEKIHIVKTAIVKCYIDSPFGLGNALASITYATTRGILFDRLKGSSLENFILPVIDPDKLLNLQSKK